MMENTMNNTHPLLDKMDWFEAYDKFKDTSFVELMEHKFHNNKEIDTEIKLTILEFQEKLGRQEINALYLELKEQWRI